MDLFEYLLFLANKNGGKTSANKVSYDNTSGFDMTSENVQDAIDELSIRGKLYQDTTANWNAQRELIAQKDCIYVYLDYSTVGDVEFPAVKIGDGTSYLIDMPFVNADAQVLNNHINDNVRHITQNERECWNNKIRCFVSAIDSEKIVFTTNAEDIEES